MQILIEDGEERFSEQQLNQLLDLVQTELLGKSLTETTENGDAHQEDTQNNENAV